MSHKILLMTIGTHGDIAPFIALADALRENGYEVSLATSADYQETVRRHKLHFDPLSENLEHLMHSRLANILRNKSAIHVLGYPRALKHLIQSIYGQLIARAWQLMQQCDIVIFHPSLAFVPELAAAANIPSVMGSLQPTLPTSTLPFCLLGLRQLGIMNRLTYTLPNLLREIVKRQARAFLQKNRLSPRKDAPKYGDLVLNAFSKTICPPPADWPDNAITTGEWALHPNWTPSNELSQFLDDGPPPIYITLGSMPWNAEKNGPLLMDAAKHWGGRIIIGIAYGGLGRNKQSQNILSIGHTPHSVLLPRVGAIMHHGGAGTTAAGLRAGLPTLVTPVLLDQFFWGHRVHALGAGPSPRRLSTMNAATLAGLFDALVNTPSYRLAARDVATRMQSEDGLSASVVAINGILSRRGGTPADAQEPYATLAI